MSAKAVDINAAEVETIVNRRWSLSLNKMYLLAFSSMTNVKFLFVFASLSSHQTLRPVKIYFQIISPREVHQ